MDNTKTTKMLLDTYYEGFAKKKDWEAVIADDFKYIGGNMANQDPINGKAGYVTVINRFSLIFQQMRVKKMIVDGDNACVIGNYDFKFTNGVKMNGNVSEVWTAKNGKLASLTIFFDTLTFDRNTPPIR